MGGGLTDPVRLMEAFFRETQEESFSVHRPHFYTSIVVARIPHSLSDVPKVKYTLTQEAKNIVYSMSIFGERAYD